MNIEIVRDYDRSIGYSDSEQRRGKQLQQKKQCGWYVV